MTTEEGNKRIMLPPPNFEPKIKNVAPTSLHFLTPSGMTMLPRNKQPPPMYGARGPTVPPRFLRPSIARGKPKWAQDRFQQQQQHHESSNDRQFCESCDMELQSSDDLRLHCTQHEPCPVDSCKYRGHPSVMDKHVMQLHSSGLFEKFKKLSTPEEIAAWREDRRKKYPTVANVQMRQRAQEQRQKRGERLEENKNRFGRREDRKRAVENNSGDRTNIACGNKRRSRQRRNQRERGEKRSKTNKNSNSTNERHKETQIDKEATEELGCFGIPMFKGTAALKDYEHTTDAIKRKCVQETNSLSSLMSIYGSDTDDDEDIDDEDEEQKRHIDTPTPIEVKLNEENVTVISATAESKCQMLATDISTPTALSSSPLQKQTSQAQSSSDEAPSEEPIRRSEEQMLSTPASSLTSRISSAATTTEEEFHSSGRSLKPTPTTKNNMSVRCSRATRRSGLDYRKARMLSKQNTMLEKLLETDIRHERNVLLQCVRYVCENNFFGVGGHQL